MLKIKMSEEVQGQIDELYFSVPDCDLCKKPTDGGRALMADPRSRTNDNSVDRGKLVIRVLCEYCLNALHGTMQMLRRK